MPVSFAACASIASSRDIELQGKRGQTTEEVVWSILNGGVFCESGIDVSEAAAHVSENGRLEGLPRAEPIDNEELLSLPCELLIPAALDGTIHCENESGIRARVVVEAANMPVTHGADTSLSDRGVVIVPDLLANAGGVSASYFEWVQNMQQLPWSRETLLQRLEQYLDRAYDTVAALVEKRGVDSRTAAYGLAVERVLRAVELRGF